MIDLGLFAEVRTFKTAMQGDIEKSYTPEIGLLKVGYSEFVLSPDDKTLVVCDLNDSGVKLYDITTGKEVAALATALGPRSIAVSRDGAVAVVGHQFGSNKIAVIDLPGKKVLKVHNIAENLDDAALEITHDKKFAVAVTSNGVIFVDIETGKITSSLPMYSDGIGLSYDGKYVFSSAKNAKVIDASTQKVVATIVGDPVSDLAMSPVEHRAVALNNVFGEGVCFYKLGGAAALEACVAPGNDPESDAPRTFR